MSYWRMLPHKEGSLEQLYRVERRSVEMKEDRPWSTPAFDLFPMSSRQKACCRTWRIWWFNKRRLRLQPRDQPGSKFPCLFHESKYIQQASTGINRLWNKESHILRPQISNVGKAGRPLSRHFATIPTGYITIVTISLFNPFYPHLFNWF